MGKGFYIGMILWLPLQSLYGISFGSTTDMNDSSESSLCTTTKDGRARKAPCRPPQAPWMTTQPMAGQAPPRKVQKRPGQPTTGGGDGPKWLSYGSSLYGPEYDMGRLFDKFP